MCGGVRMRPRRGILTAVTAAAALVLASPGLAAAAGSGQRAAPRTIYAAPDGTGTACVAAAPCSVAQAQQRVRGLDRDLHGDLTVRLAPGTYRLSQPLTLDARDSGSN